MSQWTKLSAEWVGIIYLCTEEHGPDRLGEESYRLSRSLNSTTSCGVT